jgi:hypothetical protein
MLPLSLQIGTLQLPAWICDRKILDMSTLLEIESAASRLSDKEKQQLLLVLAQSLRSHGQPLPQPRQFSAAEMQSWIDEDEADMQRLREKL